MIINIKDYCSEFAENKDIAKKIRNELIVTAFNTKGETIILDFEKIDSSTQSFIHALISDVFQQNGSVALQRFEFKHCNATIKGLITTVINYSLE